ncbi:unnamed protein product [Adineta steineri]|uniref:Uncharacterized protein n=1 Tax=Adineta steineri TaxID=433720 RepID=A0A819BY36_9BILA|nr:unnamed protein product [Adineta steineri]CAF3809742.1 unnamed protein product [Adineta steineri]
MIFLLLLIFFPLINTQFQINLDITNEVSESDIVFQHDCLHVAAAANENEIVSLCMSEWPSKWNIERNNFDKIYSFTELSKHNVTSEQLYLWSAPMDIIEDYQFYLNDISILNEKFFYNCTLPRFGPLCQYSLDISISSNSSSLKEIIENFYLQEYIPTDLTCYTHLECNRCLDWSEICDGHIDCLNNGIDEEHCWQLQINQCEENEYRCGNGQCIPDIFYHDSQDSFDCIDRTDEYTNWILPFYNLINEPTFTTEDIICKKDIERRASFTSSCVNNRNDLILEAMFSSKPNFVSDDCWFAFRCKFRIPDSSHPNCHHISINKTYEEIINTTCPNELYIPNVPLFFGHIYFAYTKKAALESITGMSSPQYVCYNDQLCNGFYTDRELFTMDHSTCRRPEDFPFKFDPKGRGSWLDTYVKPVYKQLYKCNTIIRNISKFCDNSIMYQCINSSKCITKDRLGDSLIDCDYQDDEDQIIINNICLQDNESKFFFKCTTTANKCINHIKVNDKYCHCGYNQFRLCDDEDFDLIHIRTHLSFPTICDGFTELIPININGDNETDETECELWQCNNTYTRCNGIWNCFNGADEIDCNKSVLFDCPSYHHICVSPNTNELICLPITKANDGIIDCLGGIDEPKLCRSNEYIYNENNFYCQNQSSSSCISSLALCDDYEDCIQGDDEQFCSLDRNFTTYGSICNDDYDEERSDIENILCNRLFDNVKMQSVHFSLDKIKSQPKPTYEFPSFIEPVIHHNQRCHRGLPLRIWLNQEKNLTTISCLCPPSFYGDKCQYQNQRISLTMKFQAYSDSRRTIFALVITLIDDSNERIIHSYQQLTYLYIRDCKIKFNIYLLYSTRPKNILKHYSIHIDIYEKLSLTYRGSLLKPIKFPFLPVHRIPVHLNIPRTNENIQICTNQSCVHGHCMIYSEDPKGTTFCHCNSGWSGKYCTIPHRCMCSSDSLCVGISASNRSICICPINKFGSRCLLQNNICQSNLCYNGGTCVPSDKYMTSNKTFYCLCSKGFSGDRCEISDTEIILSFQRNIKLSQSFIVHFIEIINNASPKNGSTFKIIPVQKNTINIYWKYPFHIAFMQLSHNDFYLIIVQKIYNRSLTFEKVINPSDRCKHINEILNETIVQLPLLRRIKYYHVPCQQTLPLLSCFFDDTHFCLCNDYGNQRIANCFEFNYMKKLDCFGQSNCENGAQCLQDNLHCPLTSMCVCSQCYYGTRCQFSSNGFSLSLDAILGYHILPHIKIIQQPHTVKFSLALTIIMTILGFMNGILSLITFKNKEPRDIGCGLYLLGSSITSLFITFMFILKFSILIHTQISYSTNRLFLSSQCITIDFLLRIGLYMDQWFYACVAIERMITTIKGIHFNKKTSKKMAQYIIPMIVILIISTTIHDPIHRRLIYDEDNDEKRIWCIASYSSRIQIYDSFVNIFHFFIPFIINLISAIMIIRTTARLHRAVHPQEIYQRVLHVQIQRHSHLLYAPIILIILAIPRSILSFVSGCMKSVDDSWVFLIGYFISFIPPTITFILFVLPSKSYKKEFWKSIKKYRTTIQTHLHIDS